MKRSTKRSYFLLLLTLIVLTLTHAVQSFRGHRKPGRERKPEVGHEDKQEQGDGRPVILHPYLFALFPSLSLVSDHAQLLSINRSVVAVATGTLLTSHNAFRFLASVLKDKEKAGELVSAMLLLFFAYGHVYDFLKINLKRREVRHRHLLPAWGALAVGATGLSLREKANKDSYSTFLNVVSSSLVATSALQIVRNELATKAKWQPRRFAGMRLSDEAARPDIYYIILDGHASSSTLEAFYDYDLGAFTERLRAKGFFVADKSYSNYAMTMLSLASSLNMDYLDAPGHPNDSGKADLSLLNQMIADNAVMSFLRSAGYQLFFLGSGFGITQKNQYADVDIACGYVDETIGRYIQSTLFRVLADRWRLIARDKHNRVRRMFSELSNIHHVDGPKFTFAHVPSPQWPFLFDAAGNLPSGANLTPAQQKEAYVNQLRFIDKQVEALVNELITCSTNPPIIILQSDHGPNFAFPGQYHLQQPHPEVLREKMRIFNAFYLPGREQGWLYDSISPVNAFRFIFNRYFGCDFPLLNDVSYFSTLKAPYCLSDVTELVVKD